MARRRRYFFEVVVFPDDDALGRVGAGGAGRAVIRDVVLTPPFTTYPSEIGFTLLKPSIATDGRFVTG